MVTFNTYQENLQYTLGNIVAYYNISDEVNDDKRVIMEGTTTYYLDFQGNKMIKEVNGLFSLITETPQQKCNYAGINKMASEWSKTREDSRKTRNKISSKGLLNLLAEHAK